jgi:hypothetical protein
MGAVRALKRIKARRGLRLTRSWHVDGNDGLCCRMLLGGHGTILLGGYGTILLGGYGTILLGGYGTILHDQVAHVCVDSAPPQPFPACI